MNQNARNRLAHTADRWKAILQLDSNRVITIGNDRVQWQAIIEDIEALVREADHE